MTMEKNSKSNGKVKKKKSVLERMVREDFVKEMTLELQLDKYEQARGNIF